MKKMMLCLAVCMALVISACNESGSRSTAEVKQTSAQPAPKPGEITVQKISWEQALAMENAVFVDVRGASGLSDGFVKGSINIPMIDLKKRISELPKDKNILVYGKTDRGSASAASYFASVGLRAFNIKGGYSAHPDLNKPAIVDVDWNKALEMQKSGAFMIDVRTPEEVAQGMVPGAVNIPLQEIKHRLNEVPKDKILLVYCRSGKRSMAASQILIENGYTQVNNVVGGIMAFPQ